MAKVIACAHEKGGVGKTTTTVNLGIGLARQGKSVLLIDADPQGDLSKCLGIENPNAESYDPTRGADYCRDRRRCGDGKCRRWLHIHHVAIYINDEFLIDSTGGDNSVQIRKHWGMNSSTVKWVCFGRPTN